MDSIDISLKFRRGYRSGKYENCKYPNLVEIYEYFPTSYFANVTGELMLAVFEGKEDLTFKEIYDIAYYNGIPLSVLTCPKKIMLDRGRYRLFIMICKLHNEYLKIERWKEKGSHEAAQYMRYNKKGYEEMVHDFLNWKPVSYGWYLGIKHEIEAALLSIKCEQDRLYNKPRDVRAS